MPQPSSLQRRPIARSLRGRRPSLEALEGRLLLSAFDLDSTFGGTGEVTTSFDSSYGDTARSVIVQSDGKIVAGGKGETFELARYNLDGSLDATFGSGGKVVTYFGKAGKANLTGNLWALASAPGGKLVAAGSDLVVSKNTSNTDWAVARYNADGSLDTSFGGTGWVSILSGPSGYSNFARAVAVQSDGKILVAGRYISSSNLNGFFEVVRLNANGSLDSTFGTGGKVAVPLSYAGTSLTGGQGLGVAIDAAGRIDVAGNGYLADGSIIMAVARLTSTGALDKSFGTGGTVVMQAPGSANTVATDVGIQSSTLGSRIIVAGSTGGDTFVAGLNAADGSLDLTFGANGNGFLTDSRLYSDEHVAIQANDSIVVSGHAAGATTNGFTLLRLTSAGLLDSTFGSNGVVLTTFGNPYETAYDVALAPDGKIVAAGSSSSSFAVLRYQGDPTGTTLRARPRRGVAISLPSLSPQAGALAVLPASPGSGNITWTDPLSAAKRRSRSMTQLSIDQP